MCLSIIQVAAEEEWRLQRTVGDSTRMRAAERRRGRAPRPHVSVSRRQDIVLWLRRHVLTPAFTR